VERQAEQEVAESDAEHQRRHRAADEEPPVPGVAPARVVHLAAEVEAHRPEEECEQDEQQRPVESGERRRVDQRPRRKGRAAGGDEPDLVALPRRAHRIDDDAALLVVLAEERQQCAHAHVEAVGHGEADQQHADEQPPDDLERFVVEDHDATPFAGASSIE
jgi:hypothetical protein